MRKDLILRTCFNCSRDVYKRRSESYSTVFCGRECQAADMITGIMVSCSNCGTEAYRTQSELKRSKSGNFFCGRSCATSFNNKAHKSGINHPNYSDGSGSYRTRALRECGKYCSNLECELTKAGINIPIPLLDVDHIDGDRNNNTLINLQVLCVWCHAKKTRISGYS